MRHETENTSKGLGRLLNRIKLKLRPKLILIFLVVKVIPIILLTVIAWNQIISLGHLLRDIAVEDATKALNNDARENIERMTTDTASAIAEFLYQRDQDILKLAWLEPSDAAYQKFSETSNGRMMKRGEWTLAPDGMSWVEVKPVVYAGSDVVPANKENTDIVHGSSFNYRSPELFHYNHEYVPLYDEISYIDLDGNELFKYVSPDSPKTNYPLNPGKSNVSDKANTYVKAETYFEELKKLQPGEIYVSDVIGAYVGTNYIGMYAPGVLKALPENPATGAPHPNREELVRIGNLPADEFIEEAKKQAYAGKENPVGQRFEGIVRWATPVTDESGKIIGYVTMALNHDHIMEFVDYITPMIERYVELPSAYEGNYAFIWDYQCRSIAHPRHHSIVGYNPLTGEPQVPWLEGTLEYERDYKEGGFIKDESKVKIPVLTSDGKTQPAKDTPFYYWNTAGGAEWLAANPAWNNLSDQKAGTSWGEFYSENKTDREMLPQFGERILKDKNGNPVKDANGKYILDYQSRDKAPAAALTKAGFVGLDGRYLNNAPQCTGWMNLTQDGGSGSFYILWSGIYKPTTAGAIPYYSGQYAPENQNGSKRGFAFVTIGAGIEDFTAPARETEITLTNAINTNMIRNAFQLVATSIVLFAIVILMAILLSSYLTDNIKLIIAGISRFRMGERQFRLNSEVYDEFGTLAKSFDEMAESIVNSAVEPLSIIDMDYKIIYMNDLALNVTGWTLDKVIGTPYHDISIYTYKSKYCPITALQEAKETEVLYQEESGHYYKGAANYLYDHENKKIGYIIVTNDVTEIEEARKKAEQASMVKTNFLSNMSHEIRTPMNAIIGMTSIGAAATNIEKKDYALNKIQSSSTHLLGVINDILDISKIEANKFTLSISEFAFEKMCRRVVDVINFRVIEKNQKLTVFIDPDIPHILVGDEQRLAQVIANLLTNAVKFTADEGAIRMDVKLESEKNSVCTLRISISDSGIGITPEQQSRLFSPFVQAEASTSRKFGGTGLGLVISKNIVEMMDGNIGVQSELGKGSTFYFTACLARGKGEQKKLLNADMNLENIRILAVDDDPDILAFFTETAEQIGVTCDTTRNGLDALAMIAESGQYNIYFIDWNMPEMNGIALADAISEKGMTNAVIVMMSATDWSFIQEDAQKVGITKFLSKPLFSTAIVDCINECLGIQPQETGDQSDKMPDFEGYCILLAEDVEINREIVLALLEPTNIKIECAVNGIEAVDMFTANPEKYGMIFMDLQMPEMDGLTATKSIRESDIPRAKEIPIVAMTANVFVEDVEKCLEAGMNGHIGKPLDLNEVVDQLKKYLS
jgi:PAS domain S-box-containing protein